MTSLLLKSYGNGLLYFRLTSFTLHTDKDRATLFLALLFAPPRCPVNLDHATEPRYV